LYGHRYRKRTDGKGPAAGNAFCDVCLQKHGRGGGQALWAFDAGALINRRSFVAGAVQFTFAIIRNGAGFDCTVTALWGREAGVPYISMRAMIDGTWVQLVSSKQSSSSCQIAANDAKRHAPATIEGPEPAPKGPK
jgi:hypothetical protein